MDFQTLGTALVTNWPVWFVTITLIVAAWIDGKELRVPNWITFPMIISGWVYCALQPLWGSGEQLWYQGLLLSLTGTAVGLGLLLPAYAIGGMGAGDVKLLAGVGAWVGGTHTFYAFCWSAVIGGVLAVLMVLSRHAWGKHKNQFFMILHEIMTIGKPGELAAIAAERKPRMFLLPYGIPIAIGSIMYFFWAGMLV
ncbi:MAG: A24 family peptidase [Pirellulales bacterium]|nr:A24 family peptidase [Pirellulales bacterium]